ncbi:DUF1007 family protein [Photobacterium jeanii]|uniref:DUF1007 family protein n=1 Tax=Photobacterium jeanii TaxID=858640 RepID=UPI0009FFCA84|nr:DUF1007 domain-containing protein [Photobacterium jeanii]
MPSLFAQRRISKPSASHTSHTVTKLSLRQRLLGSLTLGCLLISPSIALAHPHSWVDIHTQVLGDEQHITGFKMDWTFDAMTSAYMLDGEDMSAEKRDATFQSIADSVMDNLLQEHYFTYFYDNEQPIKYKVSPGGKLSQNRMKLTLSFEIPLAKPKPLPQKPLELRVFEPSYYVDLAWKSNQDITLSPELAKHCQIQVINPEPTAEQMSYAMSLPADADPDNALGQLFTQTLTIACQSKG